MHDLKSFFKSINFEYDEKTFANVEIAKVVLNKKQEVFNVYLHSPKVLPYEVMNKLITSNYLINNIYKCLIHISYEEITKADVLNYLQEIVKEIVLNKPSLISLEESIPKIDDDII